MTMMKDATPRATSRASRLSLPAVPSIKMERAAWQSGYEVVAGVDEVGRGAWAGPLVAAAVVLPRDPNTRRRLTRMLNRAGLQPNDSKLITPEARVHIVDVLGSVGIPLALSEVPARDIDEFGLADANRHALRTAVERLGGVDYALIDAFSVPNLCCDGKALVGGDRRCLAIALASIVAKVHRDRLMGRLEERYPGYGFAQHKGYGTAVHAEALERLGVSDQHRRTFRPVAERLVRV